MFCTFWLQKVLFATAACNFGASDVRKVLRNWRVLYMFTSKCAFRHSGVHFFDIWTPKSAPRPSVHFHFTMCFSPQVHANFDIRTPKSASERICFAHFYFKMCVSPQRRACFRHRIFKKCSEADMFCTFSLQNAFFATAACNFWFLLWAATSAPAALTDLLLESFGLTRHTNHWKHIAFRDFSNIWRGCIFFLLTFALLHLLSADLTTLLCF